MSEAQLEDVKNGVLSEPMYASEQLQWLTDEGWKLYHIRNKNSDFYSKEIECIKITCNSLEPKLSERLLLIDVGAGDVNQKSLAMLRILFSSNPKRHICYIPIDISENVVNWSKLSEKLPEFSSQIEHIVPVVGDMVHLLREIDNYIPDSYKDWPILFSSFGPNTMPLPNRVYLESFSEICQIIKKKGSGWFLVTYLELNDKTPEMVTQHVFNKMDMTGMLRSILLGFNKLAEADLDLSAFEYKTKFAEKFTTEGVDGHWSGAVYYAEAKEDVAFSSALLNIDRKVIKKGEMIRLSEGAVKSHYYEKKYLISLGDKHGLPFHDKWQEDSGLLSCMAYKL